MNNYYSHMVIFYIAMFAFRTGAEEIYQPETPAVDEVQYINEVHEQDQADTAGEILQTIKGDFTMTGRELMDEVYRRHRQYPYVYEEQSMVMIDRDGLRDTRKIRRYTRVEDDGSVNFLLVFDSPYEVKGVSMLAFRDPAGVITKSVYLPAFGEQLIRGEEENGENSSFLGSDFSVENLTGEVLDNYFYVRRQDARIDEVNYFVVDVYESKDDARDKKVLRRHYIQKNNYYITQTHHYDRHGRVYKKQSNHDLKKLDDDMWRPNMMLMENLKDQHKTLIKIDRRIFSRDYVPQEIFSAEWLYENFPHKVPEDLEDDGKNEEDIVGNNDRSTPPVI